MRSTTRIPRIAWIMFFLGLAPSIVMGVDIFILEDNANNQVVKVKDTGELQIIANNSTVGLRVSQSGAGDILNLYDGASEVLTVVDGGRVGVGAPSPNAAAIMEWSSTTMGILPPRMTTAQRDAIGSVPEGLVVWNSSSNALNVHDGAAWRAFTTGSFSGGTPTQDQGQSNTSPNSLWPGNSGATDTVLVTPTKAKNTVVVVAAVAQGHPAQNSTATLKIEDSTPTELNNNSTPQTFDRVALVICIATKDDVSTGGETFTATAGGNISGRIVRMGAVVIE